ncbi:MAG: bifunctional riboflavin kinase/FAD synthetase [Frankiales bacterium]|nr:bifunctional riboflavin kinase/FAD synthetase [Frankiales bacterium]
MLRWSSLEQVPPGWGPSVVCIGVFDGVHRGHRTIIDRAVTLAGERQMQSVVVTFDPHPAKVVGRPVPLMLGSLAARARLLTDAGVDGMLVLPFTREVSEWTPEEFVQRLLVDRLHTAHVVVGQNFRFGHRQSGDVDLLTKLGDEHGFTVESAPLLTGDSAPYSSTWIRERIAAGEVADAAVALGRAYTVDGPVVRGNGRGRPMGYPTANVEVREEMAVPADGVYAGWLVRADGTRLPAAISVGTNPTFDGTERRVEAYALDVDLDLYGEHVAVEFTTWLRGMVRFDSVDELVSQMRQDVDDVRRIVR